MATNWMFGVELNMTFHAKSPNGQCQGVFWREMGGISYRFHHVPAQCQCMGGPSQELVGPMLDALLLKINRWFDDGPCDDLEAVVIVFLKNVLRCPLPRELRAKPPTEQEIGEVTEEDWDELTSQLALPTPVVSLR
ncbi:hypothetical protein F4809DRAFT_645888 [Biscogniauxia mediterranea]|nr:hypothetical protein F4809DRAFT_645888 [Biscogniauxia mediterranea]